MRKKTNQNRSIMSVVGQFVWSIRFLHTPTIYRINVHYNFNFILKDEPFIWSKIKESPNEYSKSHLLSAGIKNSHLEYEITFGAYTEFIIWK